MHKVAVWGFHYGSYGDDAMMIQIARELARVGAEPSVYRLPDHLSLDYSIRSSDTFRSFFREADCVIVAAGGILAHFDLPFFEYEIGRIHEVTLRLDCPLYAISIGGDGVPAPELSTERKKLFGSANFRGGTVRLPQDVDTLQQLGKTVKCFPDMLLCIQDCWGVKKTGQQSDQIHIGINASEEHVGILSDCLHCVREHPNVVIHLISNVSSFNRICQSTLVATPPHSQVIAHPYVDPVDTMTAIASLDVLISDRLHLGVTAVALDVPFLSFASAKKTVAFLSQIDASFATISDPPSDLSTRRFVQMALEFLSSSKRYDARIVEHARNESLGHMRALRTIVEGEL